MKSLSYFNAVFCYYRAYAESVEARIKDLGILVDVLFLKDEALLTQTIDDIARRGSLYAMVISPQNETHGSVTVNILHGTPQGMIIKKKNIFKRQKIFLSINYFIYSQVIIH